MCIDPVSVYEVHTSNGVVEVEGDYYATDENGYLHIYSTSPSTSVKVASFSDWNFITVVS